MIFNKQFGPFRLAKKLAGGGMAEVMLAVKRGPGAFDRVVALKCMFEHLESDRNLVTMFEQEGRLGGLFQHPNLVSVFDVARIEGRHTLVMEFVAGQTISAIRDQLASRGGSISVPVAIEIAAQTAEGLHHAHTAKQFDGTDLKVVHRDVSPDNILVSYDGVVKVTDFGVAVAANSNAEQGSLAGKVAYMSPEQCRGKHVDRRSDVFALGTILHEMLTSSRLFKRADSVQSIRAITEDPVAAPSASNPDVPAELDAVVLRALAQDPSARYESAQAFAAALRAQLADYTGETSRLELADLMQASFSDEKSEVAAIIDKALNAPAHSQNTVDLASIDTSQTRAALIHEEGAGLDELAAASVQGLPDIPASQTGAGDADDGPLVPGVPDALMASRLARAERKSKLLGGGLALALLCAVGAFVLGRSQGGGGEVAETVEEAVIETVSVAVNSEPEGALVFMNDAQLPGVTPMTVFMPAGRQSTLRMELEGYLRTDARVTPSAESPEPVLVELDIDRESPMAPIGSVRVSYQPADAELFVDGERVAGTSPALVDLLTLNAPHNIRLNKTGFEPLYLEISLENEETLELDLQMEEGVALAAVSINSTPAGAEVQINGNSVGTTPIEGLELPAGQLYVVQAQRSGYRRWRRSVLLDSATETIAIEMERAREPTPEERAAAEAREAEERARERRERVRERERPTGNYEMLPE